MNKIILALALTSFAFAGEIEWGHGTMELSGGAFGLKSSISSDINTYSLVQKHKNLLGTNLFYGYNLTIFDSETIKQLQSDYNSATKMANTIFSLANLNSKYKISEIKHRFKGLDLGVTLGYDILHKGERDYLGIGGYGGISLPYIESSGSSKTTNIIKDIFKKSKTEFTTYKVGVGVFAQKSLNNFISLYGSAIYAYQTGDIENDYIKLDSTIDGAYLELNAGLKFQAIKADYDVGIVSINPRLYGTIGWRYREWKVNNVSFGLNKTTLFNAPKPDMKFSSNVVTVGLGYSF